MRSSFVLQLFQTYHLSWLISEFLNVESQICKICYRMFKFDQMRMDKCFEMFIFILKCSVFCILGESQNDFESA